MPAISRTATQIRREVVCKDEVTMHAALRLDHSFRHADQHHEPVVSLRLTALQLIGDFRVRRPTLGWRLAARIGH
jgi:hypothetical protein